jgi:3' terminal RNA ribose 2'-O-methyltransferase Hen1
MAATNNISPLRTYRRKDGKMIKKRRSPAILFLNDQRLHLVIQLLKERKASRILDLGCAEGNLLRLLMHHKQFTEIVGVDISPMALDLAKKRLQLDKLSPVQRQRIQLIQASLLHHPDIHRLRGYDAAAIVEVIEHIELYHLPLFEKAIFGYAKPKTIVLTTPNIEYNLKKGLPKGKLRHPDHRFEWTRNDFSAWAKRVATEFKYTVSFLPIGDMDEKVGSPTQLALFQSMPDSHLADSRFIDVI